MKQKLRGPSLFCAVLLALATEARADFQLCNRMSYVIEAAAGFEEKGSTITRGWFRLDPGECRAVVAGAVAAERFFLHARALAPYGASPLPQTGQTELCVGADVFAIPAAARGCTRTGQHFVRFNEIRPSENERGFIAALAEEAQYNEEQARLAGFQRLLIMAGYDASPIDGLKGPKTDSALALFLKDRSLPAEAASASGFFDVLLDAAQKPEGTGFVWCNETSNTVMAAIGSEDKGALVTRGWYRVEPGKCTRPDVLGRPRRLYSYGEAVDSNGQVIRRGGAPLAWGGNVTLCTREAMFELSDHKECLVRGLNATGFIAVDLAVQGATTVRFREP